MTTGLAAMVRSGAEWAWAVGGVGVDACSGIMLTTTLKTRDRQSSAIGTHSCAVGVLPPPLMPCLTSRVCTGKSWISDEAVANVSARACELSGILPML